MVALVEDGDVDVEDVTVDEQTLIRNSVADNFVNGSTAGLGEVVVVQRRWVGLNIGQYSVPRCGPLRTTHVAFDTSLVHDLVDVVG